jgi:hypothetical protein
MSMQSIKFDEAREFARGLGLKNYSEWRSFCSSKDKPKGIPCEPSIVYKDKGWKDYGDWLNYKSISKNIFKRKYFINHNFFRTWSPDMAYTLGFWWTDGNMPKNKKHFQILLQTRDDYILKSMLNKMNSNYPIYTAYRKNKTKKYSLLCVFSPEINNDIIKLGGSPNKSKTIGFPKVPKKYLPDFIRGLWDGDGTICVKKKSYTAKIISASKEFIEKLKTSLVNNIPGIVDFCIYKDNKGYYHICLNGHNTKLLYQYMYKSNSDMCLIRKKELFKKHSEMYKDQRGLVVKFCLFEEARKFSLSLNLKNREKWFEYCKYGDNFPNNMPKNPKNCYLKEWRGWKYWLGN